jgi:hypothetical protein
MALFISTHAGLALSDATGHHHPAFVEEEGSSIVDFESSVEVVLSRGCNRPILSVIIMSLALYVAVNRCLRFQLYPLHNVSSSFLHLLYSISHVSFDRGPRPPRSSIF